MGYRSIFPPQNRWPRLIIHIDLYVFFFFNGGKWVQMFVLKKRYQIKKIFFEVMSSNYYCHLPIQHINQCKKKNLKNGQNLPI